MSLCPSLSHPFVNEIRSGLTFKLKYDIEIIENRADKTGIGGKRGAIGRREELSDHQV